MHLVMWPARGILVWMMVKYGKKLRKDVHKLPFRDLVAKLARYGDTDRNVVERALREILSPARLWRGAEVCLYQDNHRSSIHLAIGTNRSAKIRLAMVRRNCFNLCQALGMGYCESSGLPTG